MKKIVATSIFADDDTITLNVSQIDDYAIAYNEDDGNDVVVVGVEAGETSIHMTARDTGGLGSVQHSMTIMVDPGPTLHADNRLPDEIVTVLEAAADTYVILDIPSYFSHEVPASGAGTGETLTYAAVSDNTSIAEIGGTDGEVTDDLTITLKAVGDAEITVTATESGQDNDDNPEQKAAFSFRLVVEAE